MEKNVGRPKGGVQSHHFHHQEGGEKALTLFKGYNVFHGQVQLLLDELEGRRTLNPSSEQSLDTIRAR